MVAMSTTVFGRPPAASRSRWSGYAQQHPMITYFGLAYALAWVFWLPGVLGVGGIGGRVLLTVGSFGPMAAAVLVTRWTGGSVREWARQIVHWRVSPRYYLYALGLPAALLAIVNVELALLGESLDLAALPGRLPGYAATMVFVAFLGGGFEEPGWRGFALPRLQRRHSPLVATLLLGLLWGVWHIPLYGPVGFVLPLVLAFYYTWLYNRTGSVLLCILLHASFTPAIDKLFLAPDSTTVDLVLLATIAAGAAVLAVLTRGRLGYDAGPARTDDTEPATADAA
jgi:membrane protease YdiL (CAAX protease family)